MRRARRLQARRIKKHARSRAFSRVAVAGAIPVVIATVELVSMSDFRLQSVASALTEQQDVEVRFTFNPSLAVDVSGDLIIPNLTPGYYEDSNTISVTSRSNAMFGHKLYATVGDSTRAYTDLRLDPTNSTNVFAQLSSTAAALSNFSNNQWGYSYSTDNGSTWGSGDYSSLTTGYGGLPLYTNTGVLLYETNEPSNGADIRFKIGARASSDKLAGTYSNVINFIGTVNVVITNYTISFVDDAGEATSLPVSQSGTTSTASIELPTTVPTREFYDFVGWCDQALTNDTCSGTVYAPGAIYPIANPATAANITFHAVWHTDLKKMYVKDCGESCEDYHTSDPYFFEDGMTWAEWVDSEYNTSYYDGSVDDPIDYSIEEIISEGSYICRYTKIYANSSLLWESCEGTVLYLNGDYVSGGPWVDLDDLIIENHTYNMVRECLTGDHLITIGDGSKKRLDEIKIGDEVLSYDWETMTLVPKKVIFSNADEHNTYGEYDEWTYSDGTIIKTVHRHEFYNSEAKRFKYMDEWQTGEHTFKEDNTKPALINHKLVKQTVAFCRIVLEGGTNYFANGLLTGDRNNPKHIEL